MLVRDALSAALVLCLGANALPAQTGPSGPPAPTNVTLRGGSPSVMVSWTPVQGEAMYRVLRSTDINIPGTDITSPTPQTSIMDNGVAPGTSYIYLVVAVYPDRSQSAAAPVQLVPATPVVEAAPGKFQRSFTSPPLTGVIASPPPAPPAQLLGTPVKLASPRGARSPLQAGVPPVWAGVQPLVQNRVIPRWQPAGAGAASYVLERWKQDDPNCCRATYQIPLYYPAVPGRPAGPNTAWEDELPGPGPYIYRLTILYGDGSQGSSDFGYTRPDPRNPAWVTAVPSAGGFVLVEWEKVYGAAFYVLWGPGLPNTGVQIPVVTNNGMWGYLSVSYEVHTARYYVSNVPPGMQTWTVAAFLKGNFSTPAAAFAHGSLDVK